MQLTLSRAPGQVVERITSADLTMRPITADDLDSVGAVYASSYPGGTAGSVEEATADVAASWAGEYGRWRRDASVLAEHDGAVVGAVLVVDDPPWPDVTDPTFVIDLFVAPAARRRGFAGALLATALSSTSANRVGLRVEGDNFAAVRLYRSIGFTLAPDVEVAAELPDGDEAVALYDSVGWSAYATQPERLMAALTGSSVVVAARYRGRLVGLARVVSDGASICYLQDVLVHPEFHGFGIGTSLVNTVLEPFAAVRQKVLLTDDEPGQRAFYQSLGYHEVGGAAAPGLRAFVRLDA